MYRHQLEHAIRASTDILKDDAVVIVGSQSVLGSFSETELPPVATLSIEVDVLPLDDPTESKADLIDGLIGEGSGFHLTHGFYVEGVGQNTAILPQGWQSRLIAFANVNTHGRTGWCLERHDLCISKLIAGREKDREFCQALLDSGHVSIDILLQRLERTATTELRRQNIQAWLASRPDWIGSSPRPRRA